MMLVSPLSKMHSIVSIFFAGSKVSLSLKFFVPALPDWPSIKVRPILCQIIQKTCEIRNFLIYWQLSAAIDYTAGVEETAVTSFTAFVPIVIELWVIDLSTRYFAATYRALYVEILVSSYSTAVSWMPNCSSINKLNLTQWFDRGLSSSLHALLSWQNLAKSVAAKYGKSTITVIKRLILTIISNPLWNLLGTLVKVQFRDYVKELIGAFFWIPLFFTF